MAPPKRTPLQREKDLAEIAQRYLRGETQAQIAVDLGVTQQQISEDLLKLRARWQKAVVDFGEAKARELAKIDHLEIVYWTAWEDSRKEKQTTATERQQSGEESRSKAAVKKEERDGNKNFLDGVQWCIDRRIKLLGLDPAEKHEHTGKDGAPIPIKITEMIVELPAEQE